MTIMKKGAVAVNKEKNTEIPKKLSYESDGQMGQDKQQEMVKKDENKMFFNSTQDSE